MKYLVYIIKPFHSFTGKVLYFNLLGMVLVSLLEGISLLLLVPVLNYSGIFNVESLESKWGYIANLREVINSYPTFFILALLLISYIVIIFCQNLFQRNISIQNVRILHSYTRDLRIKLYQNILDSEWSFFTKKRKSDLINLLTNEFARVIGCINVYIQLLFSIIFTIIQISIAYWLSPKMTLFVIVCGFILSIFSHKFIKKSKLLGNTSSRLGQEYLAGITDQLNGIKDIKSNNLEESHKEWLRKLTNDMYDEQIGFIKLNTSSQFFYKVSSAIFISIFILLSVIMFKSLTSELLLIIVIFSRLWPRFTSIQSNLEHLSASIPACRKIYEIQLEIDENKEVNLEGKNNIKKFSLQRGINCYNISFRYNTREENYALKNLEIFIPANRMTAIVGPSGAGKSTLIDLLTGLHVPEKGKVIIDGITLSEANRLSLRKSIGYVPQDPFLFNESIRENLHLIQPNATENEMWKALEFSSAAEFVKEFPNGLDTIIGDRGVRLSGGERQRLVLARAILRKPSILVLDEATSSLDSRNEKKIQEAIDRLKGKMTIIVIAHRLSTIRNADQVIVLDKGQVIQTGEFAQLAYESKGMFSDLLRSQTKVSI